MEIWSQASIPLYKNKPKMRFKNKNLTGSDLISKIGSGTKHILKPVSGSDLNSKTVSGSDLNSKVRSGNGTLVGGKHHHSSMQWRLV